MTHSKGEAEEANGDEDKEENAFKNIGEGNRACRQENENRAY